MLRAAERFEQDWGSCEAADRVIVALDCGREEALALARSLSGHARLLKVGMTLFYQAGPAIVSELAEMGFGVFVDLKLHDIPHQVRGAASALAATGACMLTVHASGGARMMAAAVEGVRETPAAGELSVTAPRRPAVLAVTVLTSMGDDDLASIGVTRPASEQVPALARLASRSGVDGVVCSPAEASAMRALLGPKALVVTPGVRPAGSEAGDQRRIATPAQAIDAGASHLVIGRPITQAKDPVAAFDAIVRSIAER